MFLFCLGCFFSRRVSGGEGLSSSPHKLPMVSSCQHQQEHLSAEPRKLPENRFNASRETKRYFDNKIDNIAEKVVFFRKYVSGKDPDTVVIGGQTISKQNVIQEKEYIVNHLKKEKEYAILNAIQSAKLLLNKGIDVPFDVIGNIAEYLMYDLELQLLLQGKSIEECAKSLFYGSFYLQNIYELYKKDGGEQSLNLKVSLGAFERASLDNMLLFYYYCDNNLGGCNVNKGLFDYVINTIFKKIKNKYEHNAFN